MKKEVLARLVAELRPLVELVCVTRWRPEEIAAGVSDPAIWELLKSRNSRLLLRNDLHAKAYFFDERCLVGSANLTATALGWRQPCNLELLLEVPCGTAELVELEKDVLEHAVEVDDLLFEAAVEAAAACPPNAVWATVEASEPKVVPSTWLPTLRSPEALYCAYCGEEDGLTKAAKVTAEEDLSALELCLGLDRRAFEKTVGLKLLQMPLVAGVDQLLCRPRRFGEVKDYLAEKATGSSRDWDRAWQTLMRWLRYFLPQRYLLSVPHVSEVMVRRDALRHDHCDIARSAGGIVTLPGSKCR